MPKFEQIPKETMSPEGHMMKEVSEQRNEIEEQMMKVISEQRHKIEELETMKSMHEIFAEAGKSFDYSYEEVMSSSEKVPMEKQIEVNKMLIERDGESDLEKRKELSKKIADALESVL